MSQLSSYAGNLKLRATAHFLAATAAVSAIVESMQLPATETNFDIVTLALLAGVPTTLACVFKGGAAIIQDGNLVTLADRAQSFIAEGVKSFGQASSYLPTEKTDKKNSRLQIKKDWKWS